jgi:hypothetical protein
MMIVTSYEQLLRPMTKPPWMRVPSYVGGVRAMPLPQLQPTSGGAAHTVRDLTPI